MPRQKKIVAPKVAEKQKAERPQKQAMRTGIVGTPPRKKADRSKLSAFAAVAKRVEGWKPASEALTIVRSVPTIFPQLNAATRIDGWPLQRVAVVHGPSSHGKTTFVHGLGMSFLQNDHFYGFVDAEYTTPEEWLAKLMDGWSDHPAFLAKRPTSYEETVDNVRSLVETISEARIKKEIPATTSALVAVDSIRKLVPKRLREMIEKEGAQAKKGGGIDGMSGRAAQYKAALNAAWLDELVPLLYHTNSTLVFIGREAEAQQNSKYDPDWKLTGGKALFFDSSLVARITRAEWTKKSDRIIGEKHRIRIHKTKVAGKDDKVVDCYFHTSNGVLTPAGFDRVRDVVDMAHTCGVFGKSKSTITSSLTGEEWASVNAAVESLNNEPDEVEAVLAVCKDKYQGTVVEAQEE